VPSTPNIRKSRCPETNTRPTDVRATDPIALRPPEGYQGFEQGPIRPPSEAESLLIRVTRNCPWNKCTFCPVYKGTRFSRRPVEHVLWDIEAVSRHVEIIRGLGAEHGPVHERDLPAAYADLQHEDLAALTAAWNWHRAAMGSVFLQDANSLLVEPRDLVAILRRLKERFPWVERITSYSRSRTIAKLTDEEMGAMAEAGLNRIHVGFESGADTVLAMVKKGATKAIHVEAGLRVKRAGIGLSAYYMPGLGGRYLWRENALETADLMNQVNPDFIRMRTLAVPDRVPLYQDLRAGTFQKCSDVETARELLLFLEHLEGITSVVKSDHILNLFEDLEGGLPEDGERLQATLRAFLDLDPEQQCLYQVGRRFGVFRGLADLQDPRRLSHAQRLAQTLGASPQNIDQIVDRQVDRFI
jgi:hypothetical protein